VAFAMQELIRVYDIQPESNEKAASKLWKRFSLEVQEILMPLTQSRYKTECLLYCIVSWPSDRIRFGLRRRNYNQETFFYRTS